MVATAIAAATGLGASLQDEVAIVAARVDIVVVHAFTAAAHEVMPAVRAADRVAVMQAATAAATQAVLVAVVAMQAVLVAAAMQAVAAAMAAADIGKQLRLSSGRLACFGRRAFLCALKTLSARLASKRGEDYWGRTSMPVTVA
jgi:hypothetical protein